jgi:hypothetical protein
MPEISQWMIALYLQQVTVSWFAVEDLPAADVADYGRLIKQMRDQAQREDELDALRLGLEYILAHPEFAVGPLTNLRYGFREDYLRKLIAYAHSLLWPDAAPIPPGGPPGVTVTDTPLREWREAWHGRGT